MQKNLRRRRMHERAALSVAALSVVATLGCGNEVAPYTPGTPKDVTSRYWALTLNYHAVTLSSAAPYDTLRLSATPRDGNGAALDMPGTVTYASTDPARVQVGNDGVIHAVDVGTDVQVIATLVANNIRHTDTVVVSVLPPPVQQMATFSIALPAGDSAKRAMGTSAQLVPTVLDSRSQPIANASVYFTSSDTTVLSIDRSSGQLSAKTPGRVMIRANTTVLGVTMSDSLAYTVIMPRSGRMNVLTRVVNTSGAMGSVLDPSEVTISPGGAIRWYNGINGTIGITFDDPSNVSASTTINCGTGDPGGAGNVPTFGDSTGATYKPENCRSRRFPTPGVYSFHVTGTSLTGRIIVSENPPTR